VGAVTDIDLTQKIFTLKDAETATSTVFLASSDLLRGLKVYDQVAVTYAIEGKQLRAASQRRQADEVYPFRHAPEGFLVEI
jgi:hypothetical protein